MRELTIYRQYFTATDCYKGGITQDVKGVQVHSTGANNAYLKRYVGPDDGRLGKNKYGNHHNRAGLNVCASAYIGKLDDGTPAVYQTLPWEYRCWLSGSGKNGNANRMGYPGFEICEDGLTDRAYFDAVVMGLSVNLVGYLCLKYGFTTETVHDHHELHDMGLASNHGDITHWLKKFNLTMDDYRAEVQKVIDEGIRVTYVEGEKSFVEELVLSTRPVASEEVEELPQTLEESSPQESVSDVLYRAQVISAHKTYVNMRKGPTTSAAVIAEVPHLSEIEVLKEYNNSWDYIRFGSREGYMMSTYIERAGDIVFSTSREQLTAMRENIMKALTIVEELLK